MGLYFKVVCSRGTWCSNRLGSGISCQRSRLSHSFSCVTGQCTYNDCFAIWLYEIIKIEGIDLDPSRVAAQVVSGIGFIGAGTIIFQKQIVRGLTTAAGIWATSGIGLAVGAGMYWLGISATILTLIGLEALSYLFKSIGMKSSMVEFSTDNKETLNKMAKKFNSKDYNIVSYQLEEKTVGEMTTYYVTMVIKSKKYNDEGMLLTLLQDFHDITVHRIE